jgi:hypothetical protein
MCDSEIEGLFESIWSLQSSGLVQESDVGNYILVLAHIIELSNDVSDANIEVLIPFLDFVFGLECIEKAGGLSLVSSILKKRPSLVGELLPRVSDILSESLRFANDDVQCQGLSFIENLARNFGGSCLPFISGWLDSIGELIETSRPGTRRFSSGMRTGSVIVKFCDDDTLLPLIGKICVDLIESEHSDLRQIACESVRLIGKKAAGLFDRMAALIEKEEDLEVLNVGLAALGQIVKSEGNFDGAFLVVEGIFGGRIAFLGNSADRLYDSPAEFIQHFLDFVSIFLRSGSEKGKEVISFLISWMERALPPVVSSIVGSLITGLRFCDVEESEVSRCLEFVSGIVGEVENFEHRQNISCLLRSVSEKWVGQVVGFIGALEQWWGEGQSQIVGRRESNSNIGVALLQICFEGGSVTGEIVEAIMRDFPPRDVGETNRMGTLMNEIVKKDSGGSFHESFVVGVSHLVTESEEQIRLRKLKPEVYCELSSTFRAIVSGREDVQGKLLEQFGGNSEKQARLLSFFS